MTLKTLAFSCLLSTATASYASEASPDAHEVEELSWLAGHWRGEGLGGQVDEIWSEPVAGTMMGAFRLVRDGEPVFYEMVLLVREEDGIVMKLKHFTAELIGWEEKDDMVRFELERLEPNRAFFKGLSIEREGDRLEIRVRIRYDDGNVKDEPFVFRRYVPGVTANDDK